MDCKINSDDEIISEKILTIILPIIFQPRYLGNLICVEGIVTRVSLVRPKVVRSVHYCPATKKVMERKYTDLTSFEAFPSSAIYPTKVRNRGLSFQKYWLI